MDVDTDGRTRRLTAKGAEYAADMASKKAKSAARKAAMRQRLEANRGRFDISGMLAALDQIDTENPEAADPMMDQLAAQLGRMGGRKRKTRKGNKSKAKKARKTRKH
jgi:hypothetical protein